MAPVYSVFVHQPRSINEPFFGVSPYLSRACPGGMAPRSSLPGLERSIRRVMDPYGAGDLYEAALLPSYRCLRRRRPREENQAVAVTQDDNSYKILLDVRDFPENCLSVRAVGDTELIVEGKVQTREEATPSEACKTFKNATRNFQQRFVFPGIQVDGVVSHVSSDGVLTIIVPKKVMGAHREVRPQPKDTSKQADDAETQSQSSDAKQQEPTEEAKKDGDSKSEKQPERPESSSDSATASAFEQPSSQDNKGSLLNSLVPVLLRGHFLDDSFFEDSHSQYEDAIGKVMQLVDENLKVPDPLDWYKNHRAENDQEDTRAGTVTENADNYKVLLDVKDFEPNSLSVRAVGESELLVEGNLEKKDGDMELRRSFRKHFALPGAVQIDTITSALSTDGILTITAPKKKPEEISDTFVIKSSSATDLESTACSRASSAAPEPVPSTSASNDKEKRPPTASSSGYSSADGHEGSAPKRAEQDKECAKEEKAPIDGEEELKDFLKFLLIGDPKDLSDTNLKENVKQRKNASKGPEQEGNKTADEAQKSSGPRVRVIRRGPFYQDSFFEDSRPQYQSAVEQMLDRWAEVPSVLITEHEPRHLCDFGRFHNALSKYRCLLGHDFFDDLTCYKTLRHRSPKEESQASIVKELDDKYKIVLDVHGFSAEDLSIRATSHNELVVEGKVDHKGPTGAVSSQRFSKHFVLPQPVRMNELTAALSEDDILTISVPKNSVLRITHKL